MPGLPLINWQSCPRLNPNYQDIKHSSDVQHPACMDLATSASASDATHDQLGSTHHGQLVPIHQHSHQPVTSDQGLVSILRCHDTGHLTCPGSNASSRQDLASTPGWLTTTVCWPWPATSEAYLECLLRSAHQAYAANLLPAHLAHRLRIDPLAASLSITVPLLS
jgi:hypothetical protein